MTEAARQHSSTSRDGRHGRTARAPGTTSTGARISASHAALFEFQRVVGNRALTSLIAPATVPIVARKGPTAAETVTITVKWDHTKPPKKYLEAVFTDHPVDWTADVYVGKRNAGEGDGELDVDVAKSKRVRIEVVPKAGAPDDYYKARSKVAKKGYSSAQTVKVKLAYNRTNRRFTDQSWDQKGLDPAKVGKVRSYTMMGHRVRVNELVEPTVDATNDHFENELTDEQRQAITDSIVTMGGYNRRTTSTGAFSNHSTGAAVDINAHGPTNQNAHWKKRKDGKRNTEHLRLLELFQHVVVLDSGWKDYDPWKEQDPARILEASQRFNRRFPRFLASLLDDALGPGWDKKHPGMGALAPTLQMLLPWLDLATVRRYLEAATLGPDLVTRVDPTLLAKGAKAATAAGKAATAKWLQRIEAGWPSVRAWVEGIVVYRSKDPATKRAWAYASEHAEKKPGSTPAVKGTLKGMVSLDEKLVETMQAGGWSWLVDHTKDFMHFEDRAAAKAMVK